MPSASRWSAPTSEHYTSLLLAVSALAAGCALYYVHSQLELTRIEPKANGSLHRSNAVQRPRRRRSIPWTRARASTRETATSTPDQAENPVVGVIDVEELEAGRTAQLQQEDGDTFSNSSFTPASEDGAMVPSKDDESLLTLLYRIGEEQARKDGCVHRGVQCNSCSDNPIRGIRYRCMNCPDYDLCEQCESLQLHDKTHLFYKIRIPAGFIGAYADRQPPLYPGKPRPGLQSLGAERLKIYEAVTGLRKEEIEGYWEQFRCLASIHYPSDPDKYYLAIDRETVDKCFLPGHAAKGHYPNLIYSRTFAYFDQDNDGLIGFQDFVTGAASLRKKNFVAHRVQRIFQGYDMDDDGYIERRDAIRIFKAYYELTKEFSADILIAASQLDGDDTNYSRDVIVGGRPLSSAFTTTIPRGNNSAAGQGKVVDNFGDLVVRDGNGAVDLDPNDDSMDLDIIVGDNAERAMLKDPQLKRSGKAIKQFAMHGEWSRVAEKLREFQVNTPENVTKDGQTTLRRVLLTRMADGAMEIRLLRRRAVARRLQRQGFMNISGTAAKNEIEIPLETNGILADPRVHTRISKDLAEIRTNATCHEDLHRRLGDIIIKLRWPIVDLDEFREKLLSLVSDGWNERSLDEDLTCYDENPAVVHKFVASFSKLVNEIAEQVRKEPNFKPEFRKLDPDGRSRSSSKVRFEDGVGGDEDETRSVTSTSSRSRPINERWGGYEIPEPESDIGREILYRTIHESINEVLDQMFRLREDLALLVVFTRKDRKRHRAAIQEILSKGEHRQTMWETWLYLDMYQRRWRESSNWPYFDESSLQRDEAQNLERFIEDFEKHKLNDLTSSFCPACNAKGDLIRLEMGRYCHGTQHPRDGPMKACGRAPPVPGPEHCTNCRDRDGRPRPLPYTHDFCTRCHSPCERVAKILAECELAVSVKSDPNMAEDDNPRFNPTDNRDQATTEDGIPDLQVRGPSEPSTASEKPEPEVRVNGASTSREETIECPAMAEDLHDSVTAFNELDVEGIESAIAAKPLEELLGTAGYSAVNGGESGSAFPSSSSSSDKSDPVPKPFYDPTLPQFRPNSAPAVAVSTQYSNDVISPNAQQGDDFEVDPVVLAPGPTGTSWSLAAKGNGSDLHEARSPPGLSSSRLRFYACLDFIEAEDERRGGPGRVSFDEFVEVVKGEKGATSMNLLTNWIDATWF